MEVWLPKKALFGAAAAMTGQEARVTSSFEDSEHNVDILAFEVVGQNLSSEVVSLFPEDWELGSKLPHGSGPSMAKNEGCVLGELKVAELTSFTVFTVPV